MCCYLVKTLTKNTLNTNYQPFIIDIDLRILQMENILKVFFKFQKNIGIVGTKDYRKPEWVTQMEEMQKALAGNFHKKSFMFIDCSIRLYIIR